ncbi:zinc finger CCCH domain-containing protein 53 [Aegilops tauschii subsp. strangulata]|uniref:zinc finger CCCH domain-containing protein 53 n=1 Tax=Aegilops tauschii subsp. strangulata TaxID=200361 RepID=UPI00098A1E42|nr:zinc finger CCCH domain-containing protein 53 [Aegilops tauschii subsp. strangulata]
MNPASRQIYLIFPADSTFHEDDISNYFSIYGNVHDVRIPYQQNHMFGFVTFVYKEKGKVRSKFRKQKGVRVDFSSCGSPNYCIYLIAFCYPDRNCPKNEATLGGGTYT